MSKRVPVLSKKNSKLVWNWADANKDADEPLAEAYFLACASLGMLLNRQVEKRIGKSLSQKARRDEYDIADELRDVAKNYCNTLARQILEMLKRES